MPARTDAVVDGGPVKVWVAHDDPPVHCSTSGVSLLPEAPAATQNVAAVQETLASESMVPVGSAVGMIVHVDPFHISARVTVLEDAFIAPPTAMQKFVPTHDTAERWLSVSLAGFAGWAMDHVEPFHF